MDSWRYYELGRIAAEPFDGACLDVSSPKLLASLLQQHGRSRWTAVDLFADEVALWRELDRALDLRVEDARALTFADETFDACVCVSVIEHIPRDGDLACLAELWRVLKPGGVLHLTTNVATSATDVFVDRETWGEATARVGDRVLFEHRFDDAEVAERLLALPWDVTAREFVSERRGLAEWFARRAPFSYLLGLPLALIAPRNLVRVGAAADVLAPFGVVYLRLRKPPREAEASDSKASARWDDSR